MKILGIKYDNVTVHEAVTMFFQLLETRAKSNVFFLNADCLYKALHDKEYSGLLGRADLLLPDGIGIKIATWIFGGYMKENCNGTDLSPLILKQAAQKGLKVFFLGGKDSVAVKASQNAEKSFPNLKIVGAFSGYVSDLDFVIDQINSSRADILFVAMGVPLQEKWIMKNRERLNPRVCLGVGAFLDYLSGAIPRAPLWMRRVHLEWFWRIFIDPKRMIKRYLIDGFCFAIFVLYKRVFAK